MANLNVRALSCAVFAAAMGLGSPALAISTLAEALAVAYESNPELEAARARLRAVNEQVSQARGGMRPTVQAGVNYTLERQRVRGGLPGQRGTDTNDPFAFSLEASQPLYDGGQTVNSVRARTADVSAARARLLGLEQQILFDVVTAYLDILRDLEFVALARNNISVIAEQLRATEDRFEVGEVTRTDVSQARARLAEANANLSDVEGGLERSIQSFRALVGQEPGRLQPLTSLPPLPQSLQEAVALALENHPNILAARFDVGAASSDVRAAIGGLLPTVSLDGGVSVSDTGVFQSSSVDRTSASIGVRARIPLYQAGVQYSRVRAAQAQASAARIGVQGEARTRQQQAENAWTVLTVSQAAIRSLRQRVAASQLAFEGVREEAQVGARTTLDVLDAEQELLDARTRLAGAQRDEFVAAYGLLATIGQLTIEDLGVDAMVFDVAADFENSTRLFGFERNEDTVWEEFWRP